MVTASFGLDRRRLMNCSKWRKAQFIRRFTAWSRVDRSVPNGASLRQTGGQSTTSLRVLDRELQGAEQSFAQRTKGIRAMMRFA